MAKLDETEDLDALIDRAVDTFFVEEPGPEERAELEEPAASQAAPGASQPESPAPTKEPSFEDAVDTLFTSAFVEEPPDEGDYSPPSPGPSAFQQAAPPPAGDFSAPEARSGSSRQASEAMPDFSSPTTITSGDVDTDRAIDLAVDTLFVEEPETPAPETTQLEVSATVPLEEPEPEPEVPEVPKSPTTEAPDYDQAMAHEIQRHMHTMYEEATQEGAPQPQPEAQPRAVPKRVSPARRAEAFPLRQLQEAILTLEWEISRRSVTVLANELRKVRAKFKDNVTVDFAALSMRVVLDYVVKRMSRAHPESIRFLLDVTDYLGRSLESSSADPLVAFHDILSRYERYKSAVRKAEGIPDRKPAILDELTIKAPEAFSQMVRAQALTIKRAGESLADRLDSTPDPENLIRSFRFLVNRSVNRILESTREGQVDKVKRVKKRR